jgi:lipopolysaccharide transport system ATP-binding protein
MRPTIRVENLSKMYRIAAGGGSSYRTLRESIVDTVVLPWRRLRRLWRPGPAPAGNGTESFWALRDVSFEVARGEVVGIIGQNGAGKSTLLKVLSRITEPTSGRVRLRGRVGSLLEVGTGFHPELTGRENILLNGTILGMTRHEIARKFDEIVAFAEVGPFLDTPVKRYSSGMYVRLAFAVAAHLEPEIMIVDEVLAVGDIAFQRKCLGRMRSVSREGRTVLFVSHNMAAVEALCDRVLLLDKGRLVQAGDPPDLIRAYHERMQSYRDTARAALASRDAERRTLRAFRDAVLLDEAGNPTTHLPLGGRFHIRLRLEVPRPVDEPAVGIGFDDTLGQRLLTVLTPRSHAVIGRLEGTTEVDCVVDPFPLAPGDYWIRLALTAKGQELDGVDQALGFSVINADAFKEGRGFFRGVCVAPSHWSVNSPGADARDGTALPAAV